MSGALALWFGPRAPAGASGLKSTANEIYSIHRNHGCQADESPEDSFNLLPAGSGVILPAFTSLVLFYSSHTTLWLATPHSTCRPARTSRKSITRSIRL